MNPWAIAAAALGLGVGVAVVAGPKNKGLVKVFPDLKASGARLPKLGFSPNPIINPNIELESGAGHVQLPSLEDLAAVTATARVSVRNTAMAAVEHLAAGKVNVNGQLVTDVVEARRRLFRMLLEAIRVGLGRKSTSDPLQEILHGAYGGGWYAGPVIGWTLSYMASPGLGDLRSRVARMAAALDDLIHYPTAADYASDPLYDYTRLEAGMGISQATGDVSTRRASQALVGGSVGWIMWVTDREKETAQLISDWRAFFGDPTLTIESANTAQLLNLAVSIGVIYFETAAQKTCNWPKGPPSKVDTWGSIKKAVTAVWSAGVAAFSGNYAALLNTALTTADKAPLPAKVEGILNSAQDELSSWA